MRLVLSSIVMAALAANPCFAKDGHALHGGRAGAANSGASGKGASGNGARASPSPSRADLPIDAETTVAPPVLPPRRAAPQQIRITNPSAKTANPGLSSRSQVGALTVAPATARNAIGLPMVSPQKFWGAQRPLPTLQRSSTAAPVMSGTARVSVANANRGSVNAATVIRPATGSSVIGGPAQAHYGINGTTIQNKH